MSAMVERSCGDGDGSEVRYIEDSLEKVQCTAHGWGFVFRRCGWASGWLRGVGMKARQIDRGAPFSDDLMPHIQGANVSRAGKDKQISTR